MQCQRDAERALREQYRREHEAREKRARWAAKRLDEELVLLRHQVRFYCERCGTPSSGPDIENEGSPFAEEVINWDRPASLDPCLICARLLCRRCGKYDIGLGWRCVVPFLRCEQPSHRH
ncbi:MAG: hypothetical protein M3464_05455 [Chloroflexota bacterium]|nr:hypothetical protein [Chloroflexota bacterium]